MRVALTLVVAALSLAGCAHRGPQAEPAPPNWRAVATQIDRGRIRDWRTGWIEALRSAHAAGHSADIANEGVLLQPDAALAGAELPDGLYGCRVIKVGARSEGLLDYIAYPQFDCRVAREDGLRHFVKLSGSQRPVGHLYPENDRRMVFLGTLTLGDERMAMKYGQDRERNLAGVLERIGPERWRLVLPYPHFESKLDVIELLPRTSRRP